MIFAETWIWLPADRYPTHQTTRLSGFCKGQDGSYCVAEFKRVYTFGKRIACAHLRFSADTELQLFCNGKILATGPATVAGDFIGNDRVRDRYYATELRVRLDTDTLDLFSRVKLMPVKICEYSKGHGGFMLSGHITFADGTKAVISTDNSWQVRYNGAYTAPYCYDGRIVPGPYLQAEQVANIWHTETAPLRTRTEEQIFPEPRSAITVGPHEEKEVVLTFDRIYAGFIHVDVQTRGPLYVKLRCRETDEPGSMESFIFDRDTTYRGLQLHSAGEFVLRIKNSSDFCAEVAPSLIATCYPVDSVYQTVTDDADLNRVLDVCIHTLKYCRQLHHLDSPRHCEPLACTGDYYIESLMEAFAFGDLTLSEFDVLRTAELLRNHDGRMFHTTYSLIWVRMLYDVYLYSANKAMLAQCEDALILLLDRFATYIGDNGLIETPPDYMFVDWIYIDGYSMHHPPKALGQTCLNLFYFDALGAAADVFDVLGEAAMADACIQKREQLRRAVNSLLFDKDSGLYFAGLNTKTPEHMLYQYLPQNTEKRYFLKHANILAAYVGICERKLAREIIHKVMSDTCPGTYQPYFAHYLLEAIYRNGLRDTYTLAVLGQWKEPVLSCSKGLVEGFIAPEADYSFDHSHAWGGTPLYSLPRAILGLRIIRPGLSEIELSPSLLGLRYARAVLPTPYGEVVCEMREHEEPVITCPDAVVLHMRSAKR